MNVLNQGTASNISTSYICGHMNNSGKNETMESNLILEEK